MNKFDKEVEQTLLNQEAAMLKELEKTYTKALGDVKARLRFLLTKEQTQSVIYQVNYQKALEAQLNAIIEVLKQDNITKINDFLETMYETGYLGIQYSLTKQGVPILTPINQEQVTKTIEKKIEDMTFADRENVNMNVFKTKIKDEISRGIANGSTYAQIAHQLSIVTGEDIKKSFRIARTEGHRVANEAKLEAIRKGKEQGADLVKQWDSVLDKKTRKAHQELDGQVRELEEKFSSSGGETMAPGQFGKAKQDINCRCVLLSRPRWAVEASETRVKSAIIENEFGEEVRALIETKNYEDYKNKIYKIVENDDKELQETIRRGHERIQEYERHGGYKKWLKAQEKNASKNVVVATNTIKKADYTNLSQCYQKVSLTGIETSYANDIKERLLELQNEYPINTNIEITARTKQGVLGYNRNGIRSAKLHGSNNAAVYVHNINLNSTHMANKERSLKIHVQEHKRRGSKLIKDTKALTTIDHEYAHAIDTYYLLSKDGYLNEMVKRYSNKRFIKVADIDEINEFNVLLHTNKNQLSNVVFDKMKLKLGIDNDADMWANVKKELGSYAITDKKEFLAEGFSNMRNLEEEDKTEFIKLFEQIFNEEFGAIQNENNK